MNDRTADLAGDLSSGNGVPNRRRPIRRTRAGVARERRPVGPLRRWSVADLRASAIARASAEGVAH